MLANRIKVLVVDDEKIILKIIEEELSSAGYFVNTANNGLEAIDKIKKNNYDLIILDNKMPKADGIEVLKFIHNSGIVSIVIMMTAYGTINNAVEAMKLGAYDYITKPFEIDEVLKIINSAFENTSCIKNNWEEKQIIPNPLLGKSKSFTTIKETIEKVKNINSTILITGESGTGKGVIAKEIHNRGNRKNKPFMHINCAVLPPSLIESELFGHIKGAFTGAIDDKKGKFELAEDGTVFLDEIGLLDHTLQAKLLTVIQEKKFEKIGSSRTQTLNARIIAATNENLETEVRKGNFRKDLYYRLNVITIHCPPLRERAEDIEILVWHFVNKFNQLHEKTILEIDDDIFDLLKSYNWPGNVRELENFVERAIAMSAANKIKLEDIQDEFFKEMKSYKGSLSIDTELSLEKQEYNTIIEALDRNDGHREKTAKELGISRRTLQYKLKKYKLN